MMQLVGFITLFNSALFLLLSQVQLPATEYGGWAGAGLLGLVLGWLLLKHLPAKDAQILAMVNLKDVQVQAVIKSCGDDYRTSLSQVLLHCDSEMKGLAIILGKDLEALGKAIAFLSEAVKEVKESRNAK